MKILFDLVFQNAWQAKVSKEIFNSKKGKVERQTPIFIS